MAGCTDVIVTGIGGYGANYVKWLQPLEAAGRARLRAVVDPFGEQSPVWPELAARGVPRFDTLEAACAEAGITADHAAISSPIALHADHCCAALAAGMHVLCEKPLCATLDEASRMIAAREQAGRQISIGYQWSYSDAVRTLKADVLAGRLGAPVELRTHVIWPRRASYYARNRWAGRLRDDAGRTVFDSPVNNATAHYLHNMLYVLGPDMNRSVAPVSLTAELYRANPIENFDAACCRIETAGGVPLLFFSAHCVDAHSNPVLSYRFEDAVVAFDADRHLVATRRDGSLTDYGSPDADPPRKLALSLDWAATGQPGIEWCGVEAALMHTRCVNALQQLPVHTFPPDVIRQSTDPQGDTLTYVPGLADAMIQGFEEGRLFSELGLPWAASAQRITDP